MHHRRDHDLDVLRHADGGDDRVEREDQIDRRPAARPPARTIASAAPALPSSSPRFDLAVDFVGRLGDQEQAAADQDDVAPGNVRCRRSRPADASASSARSGRTASRCGRSSASDRPIWRARRACSGEQRDTRIEMKTTLSMPSTISSAVSVTSAAQACGSDKQFEHGRLCMIAGARGNSPIDEEIDRDQAQCRSDPEVRRQVPASTATSASTDHSASSATVTGRSLRTRNGCTKRTGTKVSTANSRDHRGRKPGRRPQQQQIERDQVPHRRKAAEIIVRGLHVAVGEIERAGDRDRRRRRRSTRRSGISPPAAMA